MIKRLCALLIALCLTMGAAAAFSDVSETDWYGDEVEYVFQQGLMSGVSNDSFAPQEPVSRGMVVTVLYRLDGSPSVGGSTSFSDISPGIWYSDAIIWARSAGVAAGYGNDTFGPNDTVTREQLAVFLWRYASYKGMEIANGVLGGYHDAVYISSWALDGMKHAVGAGLVTGKDGGWLDPGGVASRAELAAILQRLMTPAAG